jgi:protein-L-isoaspartate(D-aspartate) O-methyltransferase
MNVDYARQQMIDQQVRAWTVLDADVLDVLGSVPREHFVPQAYRSMAFADVEIPIGHGQTMMTPTVEGRVLQALELEGNEDILEIGTGSGFLTACLASLGGRVTSIDIHEQFVQRAMHRLDDLRINNVELMSMDATRQLPSGHFDAIAVTGSVESMHPRFVDALKPGGRLFVVVGAPPVMDARRVRQTDDGDWVTESLFETELAPLVNGALPPQFLF